MSHAGVYALCLKQWGIIKTFCKEQNNPSCANDVLNNPIRTFSHRVVSRMDQEDKVRSRKTFRYKRARDWERI